jgi:hypothetical protein
VWEGGDGGGKGGAQYSGGGVSGGDGGGFTGPFAGSQSSGSGGGNTIKPASLGVSGGPVQALGTGQVKGSAAGSSGVRPGAGMPSTGTTAGYDNPGYRGESAPPPIAFTPSRLKQDRFRR